MAVPMNHGSHTKGKRDVVEVGREEVTPDPDPTFLTTQGLQREIKSLRELIESRLGCQDNDIKRVEEGLKGREHDIRLATTQTEKLVDEKFKSEDLRFETVAIQFKERDTRSERESRDNKVAVDAAFAAQKEAAAKQDESNQKAIDKSEVSTNEKINKLAELFKTTTDALRSNHEDLKERFTTMDGRRAGGAQRADTNRDNTGIIVSIAVGVIALVALMFSAYANLKPKEPGIQPTLQLAPQPPTAHP